LGHVLGLGGFLGLKENWTKEELGLKLDQRRVGLEIGPTRGRTHFKRI